MVPVLPHLSKWNFRHFLFRWHEDGKRKYVADSLCWLLKKNMIRNKWNRFWGPAGMTFNDPFLCRTMSFVRSCELNYRWYTLLAVWFSNLKSKWCPQPSFHIFLEQTLYNKFACPAELGSAVSKNPLFVSEVISSELKLLSKTSSSDCDALGRFPLQSNIPANFRGGIESKSL